MKFRNILLTTFAASAFVIGTTSCSDSFLDEKMYSSYGPEVSDVNAKIGRSAPSICCYMGNVQSAGICRMLAGRYGCRCSR